MKTMAKLQKVKLNKKGFTLVELIVVLVILAILLAILVPSLIGWINKARDKDILVNARTVYLAAQTIASEEEITTVTGFDATKIAEVKTLAGLKDSTYTFTVDTIDTNGNVTGVTYKEAGTAGRSIKMEDSEWKPVVRPS